MVAAALAVLPVLATVLPLAGARAQPASSELARRLVAAKLVELETMVRLKWWDRADREYGNLESIIKANAVENPIIRQRLEKVKKVLDAEFAARAENPEAKRLAALLLRVRAADNRFPAGKPKTIRVKPDGAGDARTFGEALARSDSKDVIELYTGVHRVNLDELRGRGRDGRGWRSSVFYAARGEWPRMVAAAGAEVTFDGRKWLDGLEVVPGSRGIAKWTLNAYNCYLRAARPPPKPTEGPAGLVNADPRATDSILQNFTTALAPGRNADVRNNMFITCVTAIRRDRRELNPSRCVFYRCLNATLANKVSAEWCLFSRCKQLVADKGKLEKKNCTESADPFSNPFKGDFRLKPEVRFGKAPTVPKVGPRWSDERWEMFIANFNLPLGRPPLGLAQARDLAAAKALNEVRKAVGIKDWRAAGEKLAGVLGRYAACPSIRRSAEEVDKTVNAVLTELAKEAEAGGPGEEKARQLAAEYYRQALAARTAGKTEEALASGRKATELDPSHIEAQQLMAELLLAAGRPVQAGPFIKHAGDLIGASADKMAPAIKTRQFRLQGKMLRLAELGRDWRKIAQRQSAKYADLAGPPGPPSTALALRRVLLLTPDNEQHKRRLAEAESLLKPLTGVGEPDPLKAKVLRAGSEKQFAVRQYHKAIELRRDAWKLDPAVEDLLFLARCYQRLQQGPRAAVLALQARQQAAGVEDPARARRVITDALALLRTVDRVMLRLEQLDSEFIRLAEVKAKVAAATGDKDTAEAITGTVNTLRKIDALDLTGAPQSP